MNQEKVARIKKAVRALEESICESFDEADNGYWGIIISTVINDEVEVFSKGSRNIDIKHALSILEMVLSRTFTATMLMLTGEEIKEAAFISKEGRETIQ